MTGGVYSCRILVFDDAVVFTFIIVTICCTLLYCVCGLIDQRLRRKASTCQKFGIVVYIKFPIGMLSYYG